MPSDASDEASALVGYWRVVKTEGFDAWLREAGYPWALRRLATDVGSKSVDIIHAFGRGRASLRITTVNARGAWTRTLTPGRDVAQRDAEGRSIRSSCWWEAGVHKSLHLSADGRREVESWRSVDGGHQIVRVALRVRGPPLVPAMAGGGAASPAPHGAAVAVAAAAAAAAAAATAASASGVTSPAGSVAGYPTAASSAAATAGGGGTTTAAPSTASGLAGSGPAAASSAAALAASLANGGVSGSASGAGVVGVGGGHAPGLSPSTTAAWPVREAIMYIYMEAIPVPPVRGPCCLPPALPTARDQRRVVRAAHRDTVALQALARDKARWVTPADVFTDARVWPPHTASGPGSLRGGLSGRGSPGSRSPARRGGGGAPPSPPRRGGRGPSTSDGESGLPVPGVRRPSDTMASGGRGASVDSADPHSAVLAAAGSWGSVRGRSTTRPFASPGGSVVGGGDRTPPGGAGHPLRPSGLATISSGRPGDGGLGPSSAAAAAATTPEAALAHRLAEYVETRSLSALVSVGGAGLDALPAAASASEPELFEMSPAQAEDTQLKLDALRDAVHRATRHRPALARGLDLGCCTVTLNAAAVPPYVRAAWEL